MEILVRVRVENALVDLIIVNLRLRQGDSLSLILFNVVMEKAIRKMNMGPQEGIRLQDTSIGLLAYPDNIVLIEETQEGLKLLFSRLYKVALKVNEEKMEYMVLRR